MAKRDRHEQFQTRLDAAMKHKGLSKSAVARATGVDRSTIGQLFKADGPRMPNAQLAADIAETLGVSTDWLLGLSNRPERPADLLASAIALSPAERTLANAQILEWHREAAGSKIRHVPATLPEMLKTDEMIAWEYAALPDAVIADVQASARTQFSWLSTGEADYEMAVPLHELSACAEGSGYYGKLSATTRRRQLERIAQQADAMYPRLRLFAYDAQHMYSAPVTVFGNALAIIYVGQCYLSLRERSRVAALTQHFDDLLKRCAVEAKDMPGFIGDLLARMPATS